VYLGKLHISKLLQDFAGKRKATSSVTKSAHFGKGQSTLHPTVTVPVCRTCEVHLVSNDDVGTEITDKCCTGNIDS
ncbi:hypothetical protein PoB_002809800, partial [Plakobranchus ocellatus]